MKGVDFYMNKCKKIIVMNDGKKFPILNEDGRFWICKNTKFRKSNPRIKEIKIINEKTTQKQEGEV